MKVQLKQGLLITLFCCLAGSLSAQVSVARKYRVIAYKTGQNEIYSVSNEVEIIPEMAFYVPNTFTPNGDGINDTFGIAGEAISDFRIQVFNRWGQLVFESKNANERWDGTYAGQKVPQGVYVYKITAQSPGGQRQNKEGNLNIIM